MKGVFKAGNLTFAVDAKNISEVLTCPDIQGSIEHGSNCVGTIQIRDMALPVIDLFGADSESKKLVLVVDYDDKEIGILINTVLGLFDYSNLKVTTASNKGLSSEYYYDPNIGKNVVKLSLSALFESSDTPLIKKRAFENESISTKIEGDYYLTFGANNKYFAIKTTNVVTTLVDFDIKKGSVTGDCYLGDITYVNQRVACLDFGCLVDLNTEKGDRSVLLIVMIGNGQIALNIDKIYNVSNVPSNTIMPFPKVGGVENWYSEIIVNENDASTDENDKYTYVINDNAFKGNSSLQTLAVMYKQKQTLTKTDSEKVSSVIVGLNNGNRLEYYAMPTQSIKDIFTANKKDIGFSSCDLVNGITSFNGEVFTVLNTKRILGIECDHLTSNELKANYVTFDSGNGKFAFEVDCLVEVTEVSLVSNRPEKELNKGRIKDDNYYCQPARADFNNEKHMINMIYMIDVIEKLLTKSELAVKPTAA